MAIPVRCPECGEQYLLKDDLAGKRFACRKCSTPVRIPALQSKTAAEDIDFEVPAPRKPTPRNPDDFDWDAPLNDTVDNTEDASAEDLPALPQVNRKKKKKVREVVEKESKDEDDDDDVARYQPSSSAWMIAGMPVPIVISLGCNAMLWLWGAYYIYTYFSGERPLSALGQILRNVWLAWLMYDLSNGAMRARYLSILDSISCLTWVVVGWMVFIPLMALSPIVKENPWLLTLFYFSAAAQGTLCITNIIALCMPSAAEHCSEWEGG